jgi:hypothetical protein
MAWVALGCLKSLNAQDLSRVVPSVANSRPQVAQKQVYGLVIAVLHNGQPSSIQVPSLMQ